LRQRNLVNIFDFLNDGPLVGGCIAGGRRYVHINAEGDIEPCAFYPFAVDNIRNTSLRAALRSPFMQRIRAHQAQTRNLRAPCPIVDHAEWLREAVRTSSAHATRVTAPALLDGLGAQLDEYGRRYRAVADDMWRKKGARA
jgi:hypothetical protein